MESQVAMARLFAQNTQDSDAKTENDYLNSNLPYFQKFSKSSENCDISTPKVA